MEQKDKGKKRRLQFLIVLFGIIFIGCVAFLVHDYIAKQKAEKKFQEMAQNVVVKETETQTEIEVAVTETEEPDALVELGIEVPILELDWVALAEENEHIYAWIYIPETNVNYPILQHPTEMNYYLERNIDHSKGLPGCIYTQNINTKDFTDGNTVVYGHNMKNGSMFKTLHSFEDEAFFDANRYIYIYTPEKALVYEIYAACQFSNEHLLYKYNFNDMDADIAFMDDLKESDGSKNQIRVDMQTLADSPLVTLSTCISSRPNNRWLVVGVLLGEQPVVGQ